VIVQRPRHVCISAGSLTKTQGFCKDLQEWNSEIINGPNIFKTNKQTNQPNKQKPQHMILLVASKESVIDFLLHFYSVFFFSDNAAGWFKMLDGQVHGW